MQVVIDTNIIVSALLNSKGACYIFLDRVFAGVYDLGIKLGIPISRISIKKMKKAKKENRW